MRNTSALAPTWLLIIASVTYAGVPWEAFAGFPLDPASSYLSELGALDQSFSLTFRLLDAVSGGLVLCAVVFAARDVRRTAMTSTPGRISAAGLALFGAGTIADSFFPMVCATSRSTACAAADAAGTLGFAHQLHTFTSAGALSGIALAACGLIVLVRSQPRQRLPRAPRTAVIMLAASVLVSSAVVTGYALVGMGNGVLPQGGGYAQRAQTLLISLLLVIFGLVWRSLHRALHADRGASARAGDTGNEADHAGGTR